jgi:hypothetical protein
MTRVRVAVAAVLLASCALHAPARHRAVRTELFLGRACADGAAVDDPAWAAFLADVVTPRFPDGFTVLDAAGQYRGRGDVAVTRERTAVLVVVHDDDPRAETAIGEIVDAYKRRFGQHAVLRVDTAADVSF